MRSDRQYHGWNRRDDWARVNEEAKMRAVNRLPADENKSPTTYESPNQVEARIRETIRKDQLPRFKQNKKNFSRQYFQPDSLLQGMVVSDSFPLITDVGLNLEDVACRFEPLPECQTLASLVSCIRDKNDFDKYKLFGERRNLCQDNDLTITLTAKQYHALQDFYSSENDPKQL